jgi:hypothetical protein
MSVLRTFLTVVHYAVIVGRKIIDWTVISFPLRLRPHIKINCLAPSVSPAVPS